MAAASPSRRMFNCVSDSVPPGSGARSALQVTVIAVAGHAGGVGGGVGDGAELGQVGAQQPFRHAADAQLDAAHVPPATGGKMSISAPAGTTASSPPTWRTSRPSSMTAT